MGDFWIFRSHRGNWKPHFFDRFGRFRASAGKCARADLGSSHESNTTDGPTTERPEFLDHSGTCDKTNVGLLFRYRGIPLTGTHTSIYSTDNTRREFSIQRRIETDIHRERDLKKRHL